MFHSYSRTHKTKAKSSKRIVLFDRLIILMGIVNIFATLPQVLDIWVGKDASGVSSLSWGYYSLSAITLLIYGFMHKEKPIVATYFGASLLYCAIFVGSLVY